MKIKEFKSKNIEKKLVRNPNSNKGDYGHVLVIAGNLGFGGAALLSSKAVLASGAGLSDLGNEKRPSVSCFGILSRSYVKNRGKHL